MEFVLSNSFAIFHSKVLVEGGFWFRREDSGFGFGEMQSSHFYPQSRAAMFPKQGELFCLRSTRQGRQYLLNKFKESF